MKKVFFSLMFSFFAVVAAAEVRFVAGFDQTDVTPPNGVPLSGYYSRRVADGVIDPLYVRTLALADGENRVLILSLDNLHLVGRVIDQLKKSIVAKTGVKPEAIFIACTHIHTGPCCTAGGRSSNTLDSDRPAVDAANAMLAERCASSAAAALADLAPAKMLMGRGKAEGISFIRRYRMRDGSQRTNPGVNNPNTDYAIGEPDEELQLVRFVREGKKEIALMNFQCHPDVVSGKKYSGDWPGLSCKYLTDAMGGEILALLINGAQGDTNHCHTKVDPGEKVPMRYEMSKHMARTVAGAAMEVWDRCVELPVGKVSGEMFGVRVKANKARPEEIPEAEQWVAWHMAGQGRKIPGSGMEHVANTAKAYRILELKDSPEDTDIDISMVTIGNSLAFVGYPGEPFTWIGTTVKRKSPFPMTIIGCCVNGSRGYFPVKSAYGEGGYENATSRFKPGVAEALAAGALKRLDARFEGRTLFFAGDSTLESRDPHHDKPMEAVLGSWGDELKPFLKNGVRISNRAVSGMSTKSCIDTGTWKKLVDDIKPGDWVLVQFGHNDQKSNNPKVYAPAAGAYSDNLRRFAAEVRAKGGTPVFATSMVRRFIGKDGKVSDGLGEYPETVRRLGAELKVDVVDMNASTRAEVEHVRPDQSLAWYRAVADQSDYTHPTQAGAKVIARLFLKEVKERKLPIADLFK